MFYREPPIYAVQTVSHESATQNSFHLNGHTLGLHPQTKRLEPPCTENLTVPHERTAQ